MKDPVQIEIWSDLVCPWCYIGKRRLEEALAIWDGAVEIVWRSFELDPRTLPEPDRTLKEVLADKYGMSIAQAEAMMDRVEGVGKEVGLELNFEKARPTNTFQAHRLLQWARDEGAANELKERLFRAYFTDGQDIGDVQVLASLAAEVDLDEAQALEFLQGDDLSTRVRQEEQLAQRVGVRGVPFFIFDGAVAVSGAQPAEAFVQVFEEHLTREK